MKQINYFPINRIKLPEDWLVWSTNMATIFWFHQYDAIWKRSINQTPARANEREIKITASHPEVTPLLFYHQMFDNFEQYILGCGITVLKKPHRGKVTDQLACQMSHDAPNAHATNQAPAARGRKKSWTREYQAGKTYRRGFLLLRTPRKGSLSSLSKTL